MMRLIVDRDLCEGHAQCMKAAPEVFHVGDDDYAEVLVPEPGPELLAKVEEAIRRCPRSAVSLVET
jgi:ferredoxin